MAAQIIGMISHVPGVLGVFESIVLLLLPETAPKELVLGALVVYRVVYYVAPRAAGLVLFFQFEFRSGTQLRNRLVGSIWMEAHHTTLHGDLAHPVAQG